MKYSSCSYHRTIGSYLWSPSRQRKIWILAQANYMKWEKGHNICINYNEKYKVTYKIIPLYFPRPRLENSFFVNWYSLSCKAVASGSILAACSRSITID